MARSGTISHDVSMPYGVKSPSGSESVRVIVGTEKKEFRVNKKLLDNTVPVLSDKLEADETPAGLVRVSSGQKVVPVWLPGQRPSSSIRLPYESPAMFELFSVWLDQPEGFPRHLDDMISLVNDGPEATDLRLHWALVDLHIFAAQYGLDLLQDTVIDALQDLYLRCDWDVDPGFIEFLFGDRDARVSIRLRRWATAMVAWSLAGGPSHMREHGDASKFEALFRWYPDFNAEYVLHVATLKQGKLDARIKNPQLRIPANKLRNDERQFGFRQCSFHTHRAAVGEHQCPHQSNVVDLGDFPILVPLVLDVKSAPRRSIGGKVKHVKSPSMLDMKTTTSKPPRKMGHVKSPSCPVAHFPRFEFPESAPAPLRPTLHPTPMAVHAGGMF